MHPHTLTKDKKRKGKKPLSLMDVLFDSFLATFSKNVYCRLLLLPGRAQKKTHSSMTAHGEYRISLYSGQLNF